MTHIVRLTTTEKIERPFIVRDLIELGMPLMIISTSDERFLGRVFCKHEFNKGDMLKVRYGLFNDKTLVVRI